MVLDQLESWTVEQAFRTGRQVGKSSIALFVDPMQVYAQLEDITDRLLQLVQKPDNTSFRKRLNKGILKLMFQQASKRANGR